jgi:hypothetical protein
MDRWDGRGGGYKSVDQVADRFEDGTDTWFRNVGTAHIDAGEIPKRTVAIFKSRRKLEI